MHIRRPHALEFGLTMRDQRKTKAQLIDEIDDLRLAAIIEVALDGVRARVLSMQASDELSGVVWDLLDESRALGYPVCTVQIGVQQPDGSAHVWTATEPEDRQDRGHPAHIHAAPAQGQDVQAARQRGDAWHVGELPEKNRQRAREALYSHRVFFHEGIVAYHAPRHMGDDELVILKRFADVFGFAYARFLELQQKEQQNRELTIQNALERVRTQALGMQASDDIGAVTSVLFEQYRGLGHELYYASIVVFDDDDATVAWWMEFDDGRSLQQKATRVAGPLSKEGEETDRARREGADWVVLDHQGEARIRHVRRVQERAGASPQEIEEFLVRSPDRVVQHRVFHRRGFVGFSLQHRLSDDDLSVAKRFADVFDLAYDRFLELKKLETQNRTLQVEAALERVRSRAQGMHRSEELSQVAAVLFQEFKGLDIKVFRTGMWILNTEAGTGEVWLTGMEGELRTGAQFDLALMDGQPVLKAKLDAFRAGAACHVTLLQGEPMWDALRYALDRLNFPMYEWDTRSKMDLPERFYLLTPSFEHGVLHLPSLERLTEEEISTSCRFADVFGFAYSRMQEIAKAEHETRQAERRAAADRVRAEIAVMRTSADLERVTPLIWKELTQVGVSFFRCGVFIVDEEQQQVHAYLANPEGAPLAALTLPMDSSLPRVAFIDDVIRHWREGISYLDQWDQQTFAEIMQALIAQGQPIDRQQYMGGSQPPESLALQMIPFAQGLLYVGSAEPLPAEDVDLVRELAAAFSVAYARFQDFQLLEAQNIQIQEANRLKSDFLARMSHDLRTPMNAIVGYTRILQRRLKGTIDDRQYGNLANITTSADHLLSLINDILDLSKIEAGGIEIRPQQVDLQQLVTNCMTSVQPLIAADVRLEERMEHTDGVHTDPDRLQRVVMNLLSNAAKFTETGSIMVSLKSVDDWIELAVADTGPGIPPADLPFIFDEFRQVEGEQKEGTGLGLSIARKSIELLGGTISAASEVGAGTTFTLRICDYVEPSAGTTT